ncbi:MAG: hypothetical protein ABIK65_00515 [Candidatus Eisenbacteria bacterium]
MSLDRFELIALVGRPAAGKSEVIDYLKKARPEERVRRFHIGDFVEVDDFPFIWERFQDDDILTRLGMKRAFTDEKYYFLDERLWDFFIAKISHRVDQIRAENPAYFEKTTGVLEFARGGERGFRDAFERLSDHILKRLGVVYIEVSYEESRRKNRRRARPGLEGSILHHSLPDDKMKFYYETNDWNELAPDRQGRFSVRGIEVPYAVLPNEPEVTDDPAKLGPALEDVFERLWKLRNPE